MKHRSQIARRQFLKESLAAGTLLDGLKSMPATSPMAAPLDRMRAVPSAMTPLDAAPRVWILNESDASFQEQLAARELARGLRNLGGPRELVLATIRQGQLGEGDLVFTLATGRAGFRHTEAYEIGLESPSQEGKSIRCRLVGATPQAVLYAVFDFLERQGAFFGLDGEVYPLEPARELNLPPESEPWRAQPRFSTRGLVPWPDFLNCLTVFNREEWRAYLEAMLRMRFNILGVHVYSGGSQWTESFLSFDYGGVGHLAYTDTSATNRWGYLPERTSQYGMGAADFYADEVFGSEATTRARECWEAEEFAQELWGEAFRYAHDLGIRTGVGFEPYQIPDEIFRATPPEAHYVPKDPKVPGPRLDPDSAAARDILESRLARLLEAYPTVDYVWLWEDEDMSWASQKADVPLSVAPFRQAYDFLKRHAPEKRLVISGWGGVVRHFAHFHKTLPQDVIFASLNDNLGWDPVSEEYAKLEGRERWPIPWLEDDPAMWLPQFHVHRFVEDMDRAERFGCQGLLGIHWRHRIMDANAGFQSRYSWDKELTPAKFFQAFATAQAREPRATKLAKVLTGTDRDRLILCSFTGEIKDGHHQIHEYSGDYDEAFQFWNGYEPPESVKKSQAEVAQQLRELTQSASSPAEAERLNYLARHVEFLVPYSESWSLAFHLHQRLQKALELKREGKGEEACTLVTTEGVPLWLELAPRVRDALLDFQEIVSTRNDLGTLASMHNKYERLALFRLRASLKEFLGELPAATERLFDEVRTADPNALPRVFIPTRPTLLRRGERVRIFAAAPGGDKVVEATLYTRMRTAAQPAGRNRPPLVGPGLPTVSGQVPTASGQVAPAPADPAGAGSGLQGGWRASAMKNAGRKTFVAVLAAPEDAERFLEYYVEARWAKKRATAPLEAPERVYVVTLA